MNEQLPQQAAGNEEILSRKLDRRKMIGTAIAGTALTGVGGLGLLERLRNSNETRDTDTQPTVSFADAEMLKSTYETDGLEGLIHYFRIKKVDFPTESALGEALTKRLRTWLFADCLVGSEAFSDSSEVEGGDVIGFAAITALGGEVAVSEANGDLNQIPLYKAVTDARKVVKSYYEDAMRHESEFPTITTQLIENEMTSQDPYNNRFGRSNIMSYAIENSDASRLTVNADLDIMLDTSSEAFEFSLTSGPSAKPIVVTVN